MNQAKTLTVVSSILVLIAVAAIVVGILSGASILTIAISAFTPFVVAAACYVAALQRRRAKL
ncbi:hypothetical protein [Tsukamurella paurometabola]|uniref:Uncharacterized protein n=1 Tax=Tsukamurella paurometabola TaxID=2061 RepID=A0ABS5NIX0_TSUPA|nr:hypothetical protein [Tsukamurella paurometabola]MBS4104218.1 hypothetical protein [Tsukamurella paurometabola]